MLYYPIIILFLPLAFLSILPIFGFVGTHIEIYQWLLYGMGGYFVSFLVTHVINFTLSLRRLLIITGQKLPLHVPLLTLSGCAVCCSVVSRVSIPLWRLLFFPPLLISLLYLLRVIRMEDFQWFRSLVRKK
jgi:hypothetical protein